MFTEARRKTCDRFLLKPANCAKFLRKRVERLMRTLSKSKLIAFRQCPKRLWLEVRHPELREDSAGTVARYSTGNQVGAVARQVYDPQGQGQLIDIESEGFAGAL